MLEADAAFARAFEAGEVPNAAFRHRDHLRLAWVYLSEAPTVDEATDRMRDALRRFAAAAAVPEKYSDEVTRFWMTEVADARARAPHASFGAFIEACPWLLAPRRGPVR